MVMVRRQLLEQTGAAAETLEALIDHFEDDWQTGRRPAIDDCLPADASHRFAVLVELVHAKLEFRLKRGEPTRSEEYLERYPELAADRATAVELIAAEYALLRRSPRGARPAELFARFPDYRDDLVTVLERAPDRDRHPSRPAACPHCAVELASCALVPRADA